MSHKTPNFSPLKNARNANPPPAPLPRTTKSASSPPGTPQAARTQNPPPQKSHTNLFQILLAIVSVVFFTLFLWSLGSSKLPTLRRRRARCQVSCSSSSMLDERPVADWAVSSKALTVAILNLPHNPLVNRRRTAKIAFLFVVYKDLPHQKLWARFFKEHEGFYSILVHTWERGSSFQKGSVESCFENTEVPWRTGMRMRPSLNHPMSVVDAQRRLLAWALTDPDNYFFVFLTEFCVPIRNFTSVYDYTVRSKQSFVDTRRMGASGQQGFAYSKSMQPLVPPHHFSTGTPWGMALGRTHAAAVLVDTMFYKVFKTYCKGDELSWFRRAMASVNTRLGSSRGPCVPEHHYIQTFLHVVDPEGVTRRSLTFENPEVSPKKRQKMAQSWNESSQHLFREVEITPELFMAIHAETGFLSSPFEPEVPCLINGVHQSCFLFARPFSSRQTTRLLQLPREVLMS